MPAGQQSSQPTTDDGLWDAADAWDWDTPAKDEPERKETPAPATKANAATPTDWDGWDGWDRPDGHPEPQPQGQPREDATEPTADTTDGWDGWDTPATTPPDTDTARRPPAGQTPITTDPWADGWDDADTTTPTDGPAEWGTGPEPADPTDGTDPDDQAWSRQFDPDPDDGPDDEEPEHRRHTGRILAITAAIILAIAIIAGGAVLGARAWTNHRQTQLQEREIQARQDELTALQDQCAQTQQQGMALADTMEQSVVKNDDQVKAQVKDLRILAKKPIPTDKQTVRNQLKAMNDGIAAARKVYDAKLDDKATKTAERMKTLVGRADGLKDAPDSDQKQQMLKLAGTWRDGKVDRSNLTDADAAASKLSSLVDAVSKAKADADAKRKAEQEAEAQRQAEEQARQQAEQQQQQQAQPQQGYDYGYSYQQPQYQEPAQPSQPSPQPSQPSQQGTVGGNAPI